MLPSFCPGSLEAAFQCFLPYAIACPSRGPSVGGADRSRYAVVSTLTCEMMLLFCSVLVRAIVIVEVVLSGTIQKLRAVSDCAT